MQTVQIVQCSKMRMNAWMRCMKSSITGNGIIFKSIRNLNSLLFHQKICVRATFRDISDSGLFKLLIPIS